MLTYRPDPPDKREAARLKRHHASVVSKSLYVDQLTQAEKWSAKKLGTLKRKLDAARPRRDRCVYCEDNHGRDIEHIRPRTLHPHLTYVWYNLVPGCSTCNGPGAKGAKDAILDPAQPTGWREITRPRNRISPPPPPTPPPAGTTAWWNVRHFDPMSALMLDILGDTFWFENIAPAGTPARARADWTVARLGLNTRDDLVAARRVAYADYERWLGEVHAASLAGDHTRLRALKVELGHKNHPTVWAEMKRQRADLPSIDAIFNAVPAVLTW